MKTFAFAILWTLVFIVALLSVYYIHVLYLPVNVVLYSAILDAVIAAALCIVALAAFRARLGFTGLEVTLLAAVWLLGGYAFAISVPTVIDRSLSFYILEKLQQRGGGIREDRFADVFTGEYMPEARLVDVRLTEQLQSGTIEIVDGCVKLTPRGQEAASFGRFFRTHFLPKHRLLMNSYSDALVDPFADSPKGKMGYECQ